MVMEWNSGKGRRRGEGQSRTNPDSLFSGVSSMTLLGTGEARARSANEDGGQLHRDELSGSDGYC